MMVINRRSVVKATVCSGLAGALGWQLWRPEDGQASVLLSAADDGRGQHCLVGTTLSGKTRFCLPVPERAHQVLPVPNSNLAIFMGRRPSALFYVVDIEAGQLLHTVKAPEGYHYYGHAVIDEHAGLLYTTENDYQHQRGVIGIYKLTANCHRMGEMSSGGLGPHQIERLPESNTLVVANGGIVTHPDQGRNILNLDTMAPNLTYLNAGNGQLIAQAFPQHHRMSVRHFAVTRQNRVVIGIQDHRLDAISDHTNPLVLSHRLHTGDTLEALTATGQQWQAMNQYIASVACSADGRWAITTTPRGNLISLWDLAKGSALSHLPCRDVAGAIWLERVQTFLVSNGLGQLLQLAPAAPDRTQLTAEDPRLAWDNHLCLDQRIPSSRT